MRIIAVVAAAGLIALLAEVSSRCNSAQQDTGDALCLGAMIAVCGLCAMRNLSIEVRRSCGEFSEEYE